MRTLDAFWRRREMEELLEAGWWPVRSRCSVCSASPSLVCTCAYCALPVGISCADCVSPENRVAGQNNGPMFKLVPNVDDRVICNRCNDNDDDESADFVSPTAFTVPIRVKFVLFVVEPVRRVALTLFLSLTLLQLSGPNYSFDVAKRLLFLFQNTAALGSFLVLQLVVSHARDWAMHFERIRVFAENPVAQIANLDDDVQVGVMMCTHSRDRSKGHLMVEIDTENGCCRLETWLRKLAPLSDCARVSYVAVWTCDVLLHESFELVQRLSNELNITLRILSGTASWQLQMIGEVVFCLELICRSETRPCLVRINDNVALVLSIGNEEPAATTQTEPFKC
jgi:hypothetical protein